MSQNTASSPSPFPDEPQVVLRSPAELADALPYLIGFHPDDSIVLVALHGSPSRFGGRLRFDIPRGPQDWPEVAAQLAEYLVRGSEQRLGRPDGVLVFLCQDPGPEKDARQAMDALRPLAQHLRTACGAMDVPVIEALCISGGRWWSYICVDPPCCSPDGTPVARPGTSVMAAAAAFAGVRVRGSLREMQARLAPLGGGAAGPQERALDEASAELVPRILGGDSVLEVREETSVLLASALERFREAVPAGAPGAPEASGVEGDARDDALLGDAEAAKIILGLQDKEARDRAAEWMELPDADPALRLWRALARRCVGAFRDHAAAPLTLAGWVAWSMGDEAEARVAFHLALDADPDYTFAKLLHQACNGGLDPEPLRSCLRAERRHRERRQPPSTRPPGRSDGGRRPGRGRRRRAGGRSPGPAKDGPR